GVVHQGILSAAGRSVRTNQRLGPAMVNAGAYGPKSSPGGQTWPYPVQPPPRLKARWRATPRSGTTGPIMAVLVTLKGPDAAPQFPVVPGATVIGRQPDSAICL